MSPLKRLPENRPLPARWKINHGAYYYLVPPGQEKAWDGKKWYRLGATLAEAHRAFADKVQSFEGDIKTVGRLLDRYVIEVIPKKAPKTASENRKQVATLRGVFADMPLTEIEPQHIYQYASKRKSKRPSRGTGKTAAKREIEVLSHAFTKAVEWGLLKKHPFKGEVRIENESGPRTRYVEDWELLAVLGMAAHRRKGSIRMVQAYLRLKMLTGLRQRDLLLMTVSDLKEDGIHAFPSKTRKSTGKRVIYEWTPLLREAIEDAKAVRPALSPYLFCELDGTCFVHDDGKAPNWNNIWQNFMAKALEKTDLKERFTEHDMRAKVGSDAESLERANQLLTHSDINLTKRIYRRKPERIKPTK